MKKFRMAALAAMLVVSLMGCGAKEESKEEKKEVAIPEFSVEVVTADETTTITNETIADLTVVNKDLVKKAKQGDKTNNWSGVSLMDALKEVGVTEAVALTIEATDGYAVDYTAEITEKALLTFEKDGEALGEDGPTNTVVEGEAANLWMKNVAKITVK